MSITSSSSFSVANQTAVSASTTVIVGPPVGVGTGRGRIIHPTLGTYDYPNTPTETVGIDGDVAVRPIWSHVQTTGGAVDTMWPAYLRDARVIERWILGETGGTIGHLRQLWAFLTNPPSDPIGNPVVWVPNYSSANKYKVAIVDVRAGGDGYKLDIWMRNNAGYAPSPVELELRVFDYA